MGLKTFLGIYVFKMLIFKEKIKETNNRTKGFFSQVDHKLFQVDPFIFCSFWNVFDSIVISGKTPEVT